MLVSIITPTGGRQEVFSVLETCIRRQTYKGPLEWWVIDDFETPTICTLGQKYIRANRLWAPGTNTHRFNMEQVLPHVKGDLILNCEDDDYFAPTYIETMLDHLQHTEVVGIGNAKYYHVGVPGYKYLRNYVHAALSMTAFHVKHLPILAEAVNSGEFYFDSYFWRKVMDKRIPFSILSNNTLSIGFKGMPGRSGLTHSHREKKDYLYDTNHGKIREWLGDDFRMYEKFIRPIRKGVQISQPQKQLQK